MRVKRLPSKHHVVRICTPSLADDSGRAEAGAFQLRADVDGVLKEGELSVDWIDYLCQPIDSRDLEVQLDVLRAYRHASNLPVPEKRPKAWFLVLNVGRIESERPATGVKLECVADPRDPKSACQCDENGLTGPEAPIAPGDAVIDSHACIAPYPDEGPVEFAMMVHLRELVEHSERQGAMRNPFAKSE